MKRVTADVERFVLHRIANIAHHGGLLGYDDVYEAMSEIRKLSLPWRGAEEIDHFQRQDTRGSQ